MHVCVYVPVCILHWSGCQGSIYSRNRRSLFELVHRGIRTGLIIGSGAVSARQAKSVPTTGQDEMDLSYWVTVTAGTVTSDELSASAELSVPLSRLSLGLEWPEVPRLDPVPRSVLDAVPLAPAPISWGIGDESADGAWVDMRLQGLGLCRGLEWRMVGPSGVSLT